MSSSATGARAVAGNQGVFRGQFDMDMNQQQLIGGKSSLHQFDLFQTALSNTSVKVCKCNYTENVQYIIDNLVEVDIKNPDEPDEALLAGPKHLFIFPSTTSNTRRPRIAKPAICPTRPACAA